MNNAHTRLITTKKLVFCKWVKNKPTIPSKKYISSWRNQTEFEKSRAKIIALTKKNLVGKKFKV